MPECQCPLCQKQRTKYNQDNDIPNIKIILKNGKELGFYVNADEYPIENVARVINNQGNCVSIENTIIMKDEISFIEIY